MGEVWRVQDTKLGRKVAIKSLPEAFAKDPQLLPSGEWKLFSSRHGPAHQNNARGVPLPARSPFAMSTTLRSFFRHAQFQSGFPSSCSHRYPPY